MRASRCCLLALAAAVLAGCGGSTSRTPPSLVFVSTKDGDYALFGADAKGRNVRRLSKEKGDPATTRGLFFQGEPAWSPNGAEIAFVSRRDGKSHVYVMRADGTGVRRLTDSALDDDRPAWSPDGRRIIFSREGALFVIRLVGGPAHRVGEGFGNAADPAWSPDGKLIAYDYRKPGYRNRELYLMRADGTGIRPLTSLHYVSGFPAWSPDGKRLAFQSNLRRGQFEIYTIGLDGKDLRQITASASAAIQPAWSPDGSKIAYSRDGAIWIDVSGKQAQLTPGQDNDSSPAWRPGPQ